MSNGFSYLLIFILGLTLGHYFVLGIQSLERKWHDRQKEQPMMLGRLPYNFDPR